MPLFDEVRRLEDVQRIVRRTARAVAGADGATLVLREGDQCYYADEDAVSPLWKGQRFPAKDCISGWAMLHGRVAAIADIRLDERIPQAAYRPTFVRSLVMVPIRPGDAIGAIGAYWASVHVATASEVDALVELAADAAGALARFLPDPAPADLRLRVAGSVDVVDDGAQPAEPFVAVQP